MLTYGNFGDILTPGFRKIFVDQYKRIPPMRAALYNMDTMDTPYVQDSDVGAFGDFEPFQGTMQDDDVFQNFDVTYRPVEFSKRFVVQRRLYDDDMYNTMAKLPKNMAKAAAITQEKHAASIFNGAFAGTGTITLGGITMLNNTEGQSLCSTTHDIGTGNTVAQSNSGTTALSPTSVEAARQAMALFVDDRNNYISCVPSLILVPRALESTAYEIISSAGKVNSAENNANFHFGRYNLAVWDYLSDANNWFMLDESAAADNLQWFDRIPLEFFRDKDMDTQSAKFGAYMRFGYGWGGWRWIYGQNVT